MGRKTITFTSDTTRKFVANSRRGSDYKATIQNLTGEAVTITVTNQNIQGSNPVFDTPAQGALVIADGAVATMDDPYDGWLLTAGGSATGTVEVYEAG